MDLDLRFRKSSYIKSAVLPKHNLWFVFTHGTLIPDDEKSTFVVPPDTIVIQAGARRAFECATMTGFDSLLLPRFREDSLEITMDQLLGKVGHLEDPVLDNLIFATPGEETLDKFLLLDDSDLLRTRIPDEPEYWGVYEMRDDLIKANNILTNLVKETYLGSERGLWPLGRQSDLVDRINEMAAIKYGPRKNRPNAPALTSNSVVKPNIIVFVNCTVAPAASNVRKYTGSYAVAQRPTHYSVPETATAEPGVTVYPPAKRARIRSLTPNSPETVMRTRPLDISIFEPITPNDPYNHPTGAIESAVMRSRKRATTRKGGRRSNRSRKTHKK